MISLSRRRNRNTLRSRDSGGGMMCSFPVFRPLDGVGFTIIEAATGASNWGPLVLGVFTCLCNYTY